MPLQPCILRHLLHTDGEGEDQSRDQEGSKMYTYACRTPKSNKTSSAPPRIASNFCVLLNISMCLPIPDRVRPRPPKICKGIA